MIGTLWPVADLPGSLMQRCQLLLAVPDRAPGAAPEARRWLVGAGDAELAAYFAGEFAPAVAPHDERWRSSYELSTDVGQHLVAI
ncbi:hypothetical protein [Micromonospora sp. AMSO31t]|uniref:hypothetical protein n=1 Tax=Micromonospora sp. AMSO31t TaxID=2650566 RepID=UPI00124B0B18|nr:hypothetical protein [Micromonospora sp. AMSO31t]KAB1915729.1 hypothetical protein F8274_02675 [Micromonospora sp. AMSO31t]